MDSIPTNPVSASEEVLESTTMNVSGLIPSDAEYGKGEEESVSSRVEIEEEEGEGATPQPSSAFLGDLNLTQIEAEYAAKETMEGREGAGGGGELMELDSMMTSNPSTTNTTTSTAFVSTPNLPFPSAAQINAVQMSPLPTPPPFPSTSSPTPFPPSRITSSKVFNKYGGKGKGKVKSKNEQRKSVEGQEEEEIERSNRRRSRSVSEPPTRTPIRQSRGSFSLEIEVSPPKLSSSTATTAGKRRKSIPIPTVRSSSLSSITSNTEENLPQPPSSSLPPLTQTQFHLPFPSSSLPPLTQTQYISRLPLPSSSSTGNTSPPVADIATTRKRLPRAAIKPAIIESSQIVDGNEMDLTQDFVVPKTAEKGKGEESRRSSLQSKVERDYGFELVVETTNRSDVSCLFYLAFLKEVLSNGFFFFI